MGGSVSNPTHSFSSTSDYELQIVENSGNADFQNRYEYRIKNVSPFLVQAFSILPEENQFGCTSKSRFQILTERIPTRLSDLSDISSNLSIKLVHNSLKGFQQIYKSQGILLITDQMIGINSKGEVKVWLNQNFAINSLPPLPLSYRTLTPEQGESTIVQNVIELINVRARRDQIWDQFMEEKLSLSKLTFQNAINLAKKYLEIVEGKRTNRKGMEIDVSRVKSGREVRARSQGHIDLNSPLLKLNNFKESPRPSSKNESVMSTLKNRIIKGTQPTPFPTPTFSKPSPAPPIPLHRSFLPPYPPSPHSPAPLRTRSLSQGKTIVKINGNTIQNQQIRNWHNGFNLGQQVREIKRGANLQYGYQFPLQKVQQNSQRNYFNLQQNGLQFHQNGHFFLQNNQQIPQSQKRIPNMNNVINLNNGNNISSNNIIHQNYNHEKNEEITNYQTNNQNIKTLTTNPKIERVDSQTVPSPSPPHQNTQAPSSASAPFVPSASSQPPAPKHTRNPSITTPDPCPPMQRGDMPTAKTVVSKFDGGSQNFISTVTLLDQQHQQDIQMYNRIRKHQPQNSQQNENMESFNGKQQQQKQKYKEKENGKEEKYGNYAQKQEYQRQQNYQNANAPGTPVFNKVRMFNKQYRNDQSRISGNSEQSRKSQQSQRALILEQNQQRKLQRFQEQQRQQNQQQQKQNQSFDVRVNLVASSDSSSVGNNVNDQLKKNNEKISQNNDFKDNDSFSETSKHFNKNKNPQNDRNQIKQRNEKKDKNNESVVSQNIRNSQSYQDIRNSDNFKDIVHKNAYSIRMEVSKVSVKNSNDLKGIISYKDLRDLLKFRKNGESKQYSHSRTQNSNHI